MPLNLDTARVKLFGLDLSFCGLAGSNIRKVGDIIKYPSINNLVKLAPTQPPPNATIVLSNLGESKTINE